MSLTDEQRELIESFLEYVEGASRADDRYGEAARHATGDGSAIATRFEVEPWCWLEVAVRPLVPELRVAFVTNDASMGDEMIEAIESLGGSVEEVLSAALSDAGLNWPDPPVERFSDNEGYIYFATPIALEELDDLDLESYGHRDKAVRLLEAYLIAFGSALVPVDDDDAFDDDGADDDPNW